MSVARDRSAGRARVGRGAPPAGAARDVPAGSIFGRDLVFSAVLRIVGRGLVLVLADDGSAVAGHRPDRGFSLRVHRHLRVLVVPAAADVVRERRLSGRVSLARHAPQVLLAQPPRGSRPPRLVREPEKAEPHATVRLEQRLRRARAVVAGTRAATVAKEDAPAILFPRRSPPPPPLSPFDSPRAVAGAVSPPSPSASRLPRSSAPPSALGTPDINPSLGVHAAASPAVGRPSSSAPSCLSTFLGGWPARSSGQSAGEQIIARAFSRGALHFSAGEAPGGSSEDVLERGAEFEIRRSDPRAWNRALGASPRARRDEGRRSRSSSGLRGGRVG